ncbi:murein DD-endopeptidase MepM/ murein hydrolase activator NlpD [Pedobacter sp. UYP30]|uniref:peptidoglycan DD-metalloendopeptidase family protein n=1 Tax=Pedobacter sp. UYP30 TaxID=1756400 RepID=UPI003396E3CF
MKKLESILAAQATTIGKVVDYNQGKDDLIHLDCTSNNQELSDKQLSDTLLYATWMEEKLASAKAKYGIGGYSEHRDIYKRSNHFSATEEARRLHLGVDIWGKTGTPVYNFYEAKVHSFANNDHFGDYGATIILAYCIEGLTFYALFGHLNSASLIGLTVGEVIPKGKQFAEFGNEKENGSWPPHLHFQLILNIGDYFGDYPGVCKFSEREQYLANCPNPELVLRHSFGSISAEFYA